MLRLVIHRLWHAAIVLLVLSFVVYSLIGLMPGDPVDQMISADPRITSEDAARLRALYGLDRPLIERYGTWLGAALAGDLGYSRLYAQPVLDALWPALANTVRLMGTALLASLALAVPAGVIAALRRGRPLDHVIALLAFVGISTPSFWLGLVLIIVFAVHFGILPAGGPGDPLGGPLDQLRHLVLPVLSLTLASVGGYVRYVRAAMIEVTSRDFIRTARAKGLSRWRVVVRHALPAALIPLATVVGVEFGALFSGALITEAVFAWPGMGKLIYDAVLGNDFNLALTALLLAASLTIVGNLLADIACGVLDPRIAPERGQS